MQMSKPMHAPVWAVGLMSGTSLDGIDAALLQTDGDNITAFGKSLALEYDDDVRRQLREAIRDPEGDLSEIEKKLTLLHADVVLGLLELSKLTPKDVGVIGFHGQTIWHKPEERKTCQIGDGKLLAQKTGIPVVHDFRSNDMRHGGQGAPLVPIFHQALMKDRLKPVAVLNIGGVANVTWIGGGENELLAFDTGPGNALLNDWVHQHAGKPCDIDGQMASAGKADEALVEQWLAHDYFKKPPPKSLDRNSFAHCIPPQALRTAVVDGAATLSEFTVRAIVESRRWFPAEAKNWFVAGGGANNPYFMRRIKALLGVDVAPISSLGYSGDMLEAQAFAYLAVRSMRGFPLTFPHTTGVSHAVTGGVFYPV